MRSAQTDELIDLIMKLLKQEDDAQHTDHWYEHDACVIVGELQSRYRLTPIEEQQPERTGT